MTFDVRDQEAFERLQARLVPLWHTIESFNHDRQTIVVIPSADVDLRCSFVPVPPKYPTSTCH